MDNLHKKFGSDISKIVEFFTVKVLVVSFLCFDSIEKQRNDY